LGEEDAYSKEQQRVAVPSVERDFIGRQAEDCDGDDCLAESED
jgi:hypothetical protein